MVKKCYLRDSWNYLYDLISSDKFQKWTRNFKCKGKRQVRIQSTDDRVLRN